MKITNFLNISIWTLVRLHTELEQIADRLEQIDYDFEDGELDFEGLEITKLKVEQCRRRLEYAFTKSENAGSGQ